MKEAVDMNGNANLKTKQSYETDLNLEYKNVHFKIIQ
jgi:hypothetical protein